MSAPGRLLCVLYNPLASDDSNTDFIMQFVKHVLFIRPAVDQLHLVTGTSVVADSKQDLLDKLNTAKEGIVADLAGLRVDVDILDETVGTLADQVQAYVKQVGATTLVLSSADLNTLKKEKKWVGSFSQFCSKFVHCHVMVVKHPHDGGQEDED